VSPPSRPGSPTLQNPRRTSAIAKQGHDLVLRAISKVGWYEYITSTASRTAGDHGAARATGDCPPATSSPGQGLADRQGRAAYSTNHYHSAFWRVDFNIAGAGKEKIEQYDTKRAGAGPGSASHDREDGHREGGRLHEGQPPWWRVVSSTSRNKDEHLRSYELDTGATTRRGASGDDAGRHLHPQHPVSSSRPATPTPSAATARRSSTTTRDKETMTDPIMWVRSASTHPPRRGQRPVPLHWQGFDLTPARLHRDEPLTRRSATATTGSRQRP